MTNRYQTLLPTPDENQKKQFNPEYAMEELSNNLSAIYGTNIIGAFNSVTNTAYHDNKSILDYTYHLIFSRHDGLTYPLFTAKCINGNGSYPIEVQSHYGPPTAYGLVSGYEDFATVIEKILKEERTRNLIMSLY